MNRTLRFIAGYLIGFTLFIVLVPYGFYRLSQCDAVFQGRLLISSDLLRYVLSAVFFIAGAIFAAWSNLFLFTLGKGGPTDAFGVSISPQTQKLVTTGPYRYSRNPMVFGAFSLYASLVIFLNSITGLIVLFCFLLLAILFLKKSEEKRLIRDFGEEYLEYRKKVPMIFPVKLRNRKKVN
ncbi:MAG TPA: isoprenylcysteine carboxylmethyltransferase family protein [Bacteroidales bacterium]|nr:isoprenylcysteine carboxylmethyltransferase family protein [Bacteroidales bacterium]HPT03401.1 isoprenylcysteine carboxylmethyltransferase family protein [Bacteroidales bacterium]